MSDKEIRTERHRKARLKASAKRIAPGYGRHEERAEAVPAKRALRAKSHRAEVRDELTQVVIVDDFERKLEAYVVNTL